MSFVLTSVRGVVCLQLAARWWLLFERTLSNVKSTLACTWHLIAHNTSNYLVQLLAVVALQPWALSHNCRLPSVIAQSPTLLMKLIATLTCWVKQQFANETFCFSLCPSVNLYSLSTLICTVIQRAVDLIVKMETPPLPSLTSDP